MAVLNIIKGESNLNQREFDLLKEFMYKETGVFLKPSKKTLVVTRLRSRLKALNLDSFKKYYDILKNPTQKAEREYFVNSITTNETYFNRNESQFNYFKNTIIPMYIKKGQKSIKIWSAASSTGEEAYSLAIILMETLKNLSSWRINIYASDVNSDVIKTAREGIYPEDRLKRLTPALKKKYFKQKEGKFNKAIYEINSNIKSMVSFFQHNLLYPSQYKDLDIVFVSNVLIYFDMISKQKVIDNISRSLNDKGYLFLGQSESLMGLKHNFKFVLPSSFIKEPG
jgi:chemotaxis protein methyltransferase CheR